VTNRSSSPIACGVLCAGVADKSAGIAELIRKLAQTQLLATEPKAIEMHRLGFVGLDRETCPDGVDIVWLAAGKFGYGAISSADRSKAHATELIAAQMLRVSSTLAGRAA
jgi:hypothetical protein